MAKLWFVFDVDGVITDGCVYVGKNGEAQKRLNMKDIDAVYELAEKGYSLAAITAENNEFSEWVKKRFPWKAFISGTTDKALSIEKLRTENQIDKGCLVYIGDGRKDLNAFKSADYRVCPLDAIEDLCQFADTILQRPSGTGGLWELIGLAERLSKDSSCPDLLWAQTVETHLSLTKELQKNHEYEKSVYVAANIITEALSSHRRIVLFGNGGSAADAQHIAAEFMGKFQCERDAWDVEALTVNTSLLTAIANDYEYNRVFSRQIHAIIKPNDVAIGISTSGNSNNVLDALKTAKELGGKTILMAGIKTPRLEADAILNVPSTCTARIQEMHILTGHFWAQFTEEKLGRKHNVKWKNNCY